MRTPALVNGGRDGGVGRGIGGANAARGGDGGREFDMGFDRWRSAAMGAGGEVTVLDGRGTVLGTLGANPLVDVTGVCFDMIDIPPVASSSSSSSSSLRRLWRLRMKGGRLGEAAARLLPR